MVKPNKYDFILSLFTSNDNLRPALSIPGKIGNYNYATDGHAAIRLDRALPNIDYSHNDGFPNAEAIFNNDSESYSASTITTEQLLEQVYACQLESENKTDTCDDCGGDGEKECKCCGNTSECEDCDGTGQVDLITPYARVTCVGEDVVISKKRLLPKFIYRVVQTALLLKVDEITIHSSQEKHPLFFEVGVAMIIVMPKYNPNND